MRSRVHPARVGLTPSIDAACEDGDPGLVAAASTNLAGGHGQWISNVHLEPWRDEQHFHDELYPIYRDGLLGRAEEFCRKVEEDEGAAGGKTLVIVSAGTSRFVTAVISLIARFAGFDASEHESVGMSRHLRNVPTSFYRRFARDAVDFAASFARGKVLAVLEGGYSDRALASSTASFLTGLVVASGAVEARAGSASIEADDEWWSEATLKKLEKACSVAKSRRAAGPPALVGADASAAAWLSRTVDIFRHLEDVVATSSKATNSSALAGSADSSPSTSRQLRERRARPNYAGLDNGSTPLPSPSRLNPSQARRTASSSRSKVDNTGPADELPPPVPALPPTLPPPPPAAPSQETIYPAPPATTTTAPPRPPPKQTIRFTWKEGGFGGPPRM